MVFATLYIDSLDIQEAKVVYCKFAQRRGGWDSLLHKLVMHVAMTLKVNA